MTQDRAESALRIRIEAAKQAHNHTHPRHKANGDEERYSAANYAMSFTKGLDHDPNLGVVAKKHHFEAFRDAIDEGRIERFTARVPVPLAPEACKRRQWEAPTAGTAFDLQGPDAQAVTMPPAPALCSDELAFEMAEVYELALLRDVPLLSFDQDGGPGSAALNAAISRLNGLGYAQSGFPGRPRKTDSAGALTRQTAFRGSSPGVETGPYLSQFMWIGNDDPASIHSVADGYVRYGAQFIDQRVFYPEDGKDYMQLWEDWLTVQQGVDVNECGQCSEGQSFTGQQRFICTPRDLATYVHFDALYQAYLNACVILLGMKTPFDAGIAKLSGMRDMYDLHAPGTRLNTGGFALYGGPHILTLVTEVATRALKAVRYQKFNTHLRLRPEALAARIEKAEDLDKAFPVLCGAFGKTSKQLADTVKAVRDFNQARAGDATALLPMAFAEGSPMHPSYGAGHATVAGACVTILKAFFDTGTVLGISDEDDCTRGKPGFYHKISEPLYFMPVEKGEKLDTRRPECPLTLEGELNKLAANISIGRNMAGVHYFSDYYDSLRMGEQVAIGMLEEQALCYPTDKAVFSLPTFDGDLIRIGAR
ncbi:vanadium-dependent haloperoxidase [Salipiger abyssi]|uniref:Vanadium-dependent bromoperoxidase 2 n=1 Tax=Salipiger abyssi TaxID=1250539 RepID=A0A1P8UR99_9RHOB|nr:vanadium-dependent haloperoxidase [Salipiger abyssi]APZ51921.1 Vanadium-dependent bromoperoxidase 2 [Salipiger abyssi]